MNLLLALLGAAGILLVWMGLTHRFVARVQNSKRQVPLGPEGDTHVHTSPVLDRALGPFLDSASQWLAKVLRREQKDKERIIAAGSPSRYRTVYDLYAWKVLMAVSLFLVGLVNAIIAGPGFLFAGLALGALGLYLPDLHLNQLIRKRRELIRTEMAFVLHRLAIQSSAGRALPQALEEITLRPGGPFVEELNKVFTDMHMGKTDEALAGLVERNPGLEEIERFADLLQRTATLGRPMAQALSEMGQMLQDRVQQDVEARGMAASVQMVLPVGCLILPAIGIVVLGPGIYLAAQYFFIR